MDDRAERGQFAAELGDGVAAVVLLAAVAVAVDGEQDDGFDLLEAVEDAAGAEVGGAGGPDAADGGGGEEGGGGLRDVGQVAADAVAGAHAEGAQLGGEGGDLAAEFGPGDGRRLVGLVDVEQRGGVGALVGGAQGVLGVVEGGSGEPLGAGHGAVAQHPCAGVPKRTSNHSATACQKVSRWSTDQRWSAGYPPSAGAPWRSAAQAWKRVTAAEAMRSRSGCQSGSGGSECAVADVDVMGCAPGCTRICVCPAHGLGVRVTRLTGTMPWERVSHQLPLFAVGGLNM